MLYPLSYGSPEIKAEPMLARLGSRSKNDSANKEAARIYSGGLFLTGRL
jgi:hypothetical protein